MNRPLRLAECFVVFRGWTLSVLRSVRHVIGRSLAAVGADLSRPHIRKHTRNGGRICVFGNPNMCNWQC